ncbi:MAG: hypothetical protein R3C03_02710 [Pirellulaceae bacterium]
MGSLQSFFQLNDDFERDLGCAIPLTIASFKFAEWVRDQFPIALAFEKGEGMEAYAIGICLM